MGDERNIKKSVLDIVGLTAFSGYIMFSTDNVSI